MNTTEQIKALRDEAAKAGDREQVAICARALAGDGEALAECVHVIEAAAAARETVAYRVDRQTGRAVRSVGDAGGADMLVDDAEVPPSELQKLEAVRFGREIVSVMSSDDQQAVWTAGTAEAWREGVDLMAYDETELHKRPATDDVLAAIYDEVARVAKRTQGGF